MFFKGVVSWLVRVRFRYAQNMQFDACGRIKDKGRIPWFHSTANILTWALKREVGLSQANALFTGVDIDSDTLEYLA